MQWKIQNAKDNNMDNFSQMAEWFKLKRPIVTRRLVKIVIWQSQKDCQITRPLGR